MPEALFNRALALEANGLATPALEAWRRYREVDGRSEWAAEAEQHLALPNSRSKTATWEHFHARLLDHNTTRNPRSSAKLFWRIPKRSVRLAQDELWPAWGEAILRKDHQTATRDLAIIHLASAALKSQTQDGFLGDVATAAAQARNNGALSTLAHAHAHYAEGQRLYRDDKYHVGVEQLSPRVGCVQQAGSSLPHGHKCSKAWSGSELETLAAAQRRLERVFADASRARYPALERDPPGCWACLPGSVTIFERALSLYEVAEGNYLQLGDEIENQANVASVRADNLRRLGGLSVRNLNQESKS